MESSKNDIKNLLDDYLAEILKVNKNLNLTRVTDFNTAQLLHIEDSLLILDEVNSAPEGKMLDLGSGGGFPGVPLAIASGRETILIDSVKKKMSAVDNILKQLNITNVNVSGDRIEEYSLEHPEEFSVITARAVSSLPALLELASPLLKENGHLILMKSREIESYNEDIALSELGLKLISTREYMLSDKETFRCVYVFKKIQKHSKKVPRRNGMAQKRPLAGLL